MAPNLPEFDIRRLSIDERIALVQTIWDSIEAESAGPLLTDSQRTEIRRRLDEHRNNPDDVIPWEQIEAEARTRFQR